MRWRVAREEVVIGFWPSAVVVAFIGGVTIGSIITDTLRSKYRNRAK